MVSSAVYRYFDSRDALLTALIIDAYDDLGEAAEQAEAAVRRTRPARALARDLPRRPRLEPGHPAEYALLYGTPVPGYAAPQDTIGPASRPVRRDDGDPARRLRARDPGAGSPRAAARRPSGPTSRASSHSPGFGGVPPALLARGMGSLGGRVRAGQLRAVRPPHQRVHDYDAWFDYQLRLITHQLGL